MAVKKIIPKDKETQEKKYLLFLEFVLDKLKNGRKSGISLRNIADDYKSEMGTVINRKEQEEFIELYNGKYFEKVYDSIDRLKIKPETNEFIFKNANIKGFIKAKENQSLRLDNFNNSIATNNTTSDNNKPAIKPSKNNNNGLTWTIIGVIFAILMFIAMFFIAYMQGLFDKGV